jgi:hypothetical protein
LSSPAPQASEFPSQGLDPDAEALGVQFPGGALAAEPKRISLDSLQQVRSVGWTTGPGQQASRNHNLIRQDERTRKIRRLDHNLEEPGIAL